MKQPKPSQLTDISEKYVQIAKAETARLITDALEGKFGTKNRSQLISKLQAIYNYL